MHQNGSQSTIESSANILARAFTPTQPNQVLAGDITYVRTDEGWLYLAVVFDLYSRRVEKYTHPQQAEGRQPTIPVNGL